jgi:hypothetical protein
MPIAEGCRRWASCISAFSQSQTKLEAHENFDLVAPLARNSLLPIQVPIKGYPVSAPTASLAITARLCQWHATPHMVTPTWHITRISVRGWSRPGLELVKIIMGQPSI